MTQPTGTPTKKEDPLDATTDKRFSSEEMIGQNGHFSPQTKVERYGWVIKDQPGQFAWVPKAQLKIDHDYQRDAIGRAKVLAIAGQWCWVALGVLIVARRPDGSLWVMDGQHRKLASDKRADVHTLPCLIFDATDRTYEARAFLDINTGRRPMSTLDRFKSLVMAADSHALAAKQLVEADGYKFASHGDFSLKCVGAVMSAVRLDPASAQVAWRLCVALYEGQQVQEQIFKGLFQLERHLLRADYGSLADANNRQALHRLGVGQILRSITDTIAYHGGGDKACAEGIVRLMNKGRRTRRIPSLYSDVVEPEPEVVE
jgi:hypothetical protein